MTARIPAPEPDEGGLGAEALRSRRSPHGTGDGFIPAPEPDGRPGVLLLIALAAMLVRSYAVLGHALPTGGDYGHLTHYAALYAGTGRLPEVAPFFQLGLTRWAVLPGGPMVFGVLAALTGRDPVGCAAAVLFLAAVEALGVYLLAHRVLGREQPAVFAALVAALFPSGASMVAWSAYGNLVALALFPYALLAWLEYWERPSPRTLGLAGLVIAGTASVHHLSSAVLGLTFVVFSLGALLRAPRAAAARLLPLAAVGLVAGWPTLMRMLDLGRSLAGDVASASRYDVWRIGWSLWAPVASPLSLVALAGGMLLLVRCDGLLPARRGLLASYLGVVLVLGFGWLFGAHLYYMRMLFFLPLAAAIGAAALVHAWPGAVARGVIALALGTGWGATTLFEARGQAAFFEILKPGVRDGLAWVRANSQPADVVVVGSFLAFHAANHLQRPTMAAMPPDLVGNPAELPIASDAYTVMAGLADTARVLDERGVRFVVVTNQFGDQPAPERSRAVLSANPRASLRFENADVAVYEIRRGL